MKRYKECKLRLVRDWEIPAKLRESSEETLFSPDFRPPTRRFVNTLKEQLWGPSCGLWLLTLAICGVLKSLGEKLEGLWVVLEGLPVVLAQLE